MQPDDTSLAPYELSELDVDDAKSGRLTLCVRWDESAKKATVDSYDVEINGDFVGRLESATTAGNAVLLANLLHPLIERPDTAETDAGAGRRKLATLPSQPSAAIGRAALGPALAYAPLTDEICCAGAPPGNSERQENRETSPDLTKSFVKFLLRS